MRYFFIVIILILTISLAYLSNVFALNISPVKMEVSGDPGQVSYHQLELFNEQDETKTFYSSTQNFEAKDESGAPHFIPGANTKLASWINIQESITLKGKERETIPFTIQIPKNAKAGGYFAAIFWGASAPEEQAGEVAIGGKLGVLLLLTVAGEVKESGRLLDFKIENNHRIISSFPIIFTYRFSNDGGERIKPIGELKIKSLLGLTAVTLDANSADGNVLPDSIRKFDLVWAKKKQDKSTAVNLQQTDKQEKSFFSAVENQWHNFALGQYVAKLHLVYGKDNKIAETSYRFFIIPWQLLSIIFLILSVIGFIGAFGIKKYNKWIIAKVSEQNK